MFLCTYFSQKMAYLSRNNWDSVYMRQYNVRLLIASAFKNYQKYSQTLQSTLLHVSTFSCHHQGVYNQCPAQRIRSSQHNETRHTTPQPLRLTTCQNSTTVTSTNCLSPSLNKYIQHIYDITSIHPHNDVHIYCRSCMQAQTHTDCTGHVNTEKMLSYFIVKKGNTRILSF